MIITKSQNKMTEKTNMNKKDSIIRSHLLNILPEPKGWVKTDVIVYKHGAGRVNFWYKIQESVNLDIISYYFTCNDTELVVHTDDKVVKIVKLA